MASELTVYGQPKYRAMQAALDKVGIHTCILWIGNKYQWIVNYEVQGEFIQRRSCNVRLTKLYNKHKADIEKDGNQ